MEEPTGTTAVVEAPAPEAPVSTPETTAPEPTLETAPEPNPLDDLPDDALLDAVAKRTHLGHDHFKKVDAYNQTLNKSIQRGREEDRAKMAQQQQYVQSVSSMKSWLSAALQQNPEAYAVSARTGEKFIAPGQASAQGWTIAQWEQAAGELEKMPDQARELGAKRAYGMEAATQIRSMLGEDKDFKELPLDDLLTGESFPEMIHKLVQAATKKERANIKEEVDAGVAKVLASLHLNTEQMKLLPPAERRNGTTYKNKEDLEAAHAAGLLNSANDPYGNNAYRRHAQSFGAK